MSEQVGGYLQEQDLIEECVEEGLDIWDSPLADFSETRCAVKGTLLVLSRRGLLNDLGIEQIRKAGIKPPEQIQSQTE